MRTKPSISDLEDGDEFEVVDIIEHETVHEWLKQHLFAPGWVTAGYWALNLLCVGVIANAWRRANLPPMEAFPTVCLGMTLGFGFLLPIHEHAHAIAYKAVGATGVRVRYHLRRLSAACVAPASVLTSPEFAFVCLAPLITISPALAVATFMVPVGKLRLMLSGALLLHVGACSGDVAFVHYLWSHRHSGLLTVDDPTRPLTFFYRRRDPVS
jgi:hypothetical protein